MLQFVPSALTSFLSFTDQLQYNDYNTILCIGEALSRKATQLFDIKFDMNEVKLFNLYGPTEATIHTSTLRITKQNDKTSISKKYTYESIGKPISEY